ncbi:GNAT family N-acetyltransferase [Streptomyces sp. ODS05-4]|uniref:GNAT family N-acetyltransferase n=1 Tax=Streptomyces sp. ODS05-4 TaxID=2944939 RepID=UPI00210C68C0|nr:GNAT family N-acetyltransferase [Streptomyces sp. ODS05-4]
MDRPAGALRRDLVELRRWHAGDADALHPVITGALDHLRPWMPWAAGHDRAGTEEYLARCEREWAADRSYDYAITADGAVVGSCGLMRRIGPGGVEIGYWLHPAATGRGLATMAAAALVDAGRLLTGIDRAEIHHDQANPASGAVARRLGFTAVGRAAQQGGPAAPGESGVQVVWRLALRAAGAPGRPGTA